MSDVIARIKEEYVHAKDRILAGLESTPDDKINWSPAQTARTPMHLVACAALGTRGMTQRFSGKPFPFDDMEEMDRVSREEERKILTRKQVIDLLEQTTSEYFQWLDTVTPEQLRSQIEMHMGPITLEVALTYPAGHLHCRACQLDYIQTCYGDLAWHMGKE